MQTKFAEILDNWKNKVWVVERNKYENVIKMKYLAILSQTFSTLGKFGVGKRIKLIMQFQNKLEILSSKWKNLENKAEASQFAFCTTMMFANCNDILPTFLFLSHQVMTNKSFSKFLDERHMKMWNEFSNGMWHLINSEKEFVRMCCDEQIFQEMLQWNKDLA